MFDGVKVGRPGTYFASLSRGLCYVYGSSVILLFEPDGFHVRHRLSGMGSLAATRLQQTLVLCL